MSATASPSSPRIIKRTKTMTKTTVTSTKVITKTSRPLLGSPVPTSIQELPQCIIQCIKYIEEAALNVEGIFRISANKEKLDKLLEQLQRDSSYKIPFESFGEGAPHIASAILKRYFRELSDPLLTFENYDLFIAASATPSDVDGSVRKTKLKNILQVLPSGHYRVLGVLCHFLHKISMNSQLNKMNAYNLAVVFAPNILRSSQEAQSADALMETKYSNDLVSDFIEHVDYYFPGGDQIAQFSIDEQLGRFLNGMSDGSNVAQASSPTNAVLQPSVNVKKPNATKERFAKTRRDSDTSQPTVTKMAGSNVVLRKKMSLPTIRMAAELAASEASSPRRSSPKSARSKQSSSSSDQPQLVSSEEETFDKNYLSSIDASSEEEIIKFMKTRFTIGKVEPSERSYLLSTSHVEIDFTNDDEIYEKILFGY